MPTNQPNLKRMAQNALWVYDDTKETGNVQGISYLVDFSQPDFVYVAIEGSETWSDWQTNLDALVPAKLGEIKAHRGFVNLALKMYGEIEKCLLPMLENGSMGVCIGGHSLGGALAQIIGEWMQRLFRDTTFRVVSFGSPPVFARDYRPKVYILRFVIDEDPIPKIMNVLPILRHYFYWVYRHKGVEISRPSKMYLNQAHKMETYIKVFMRDFSNGMG